MTARDTPPSDRRETVEGATDAFRRISGDPSSSVVLHVPHASTAIPVDVRSRILLDDEELAVELHRMTDARTDVLAAAATDLASGPRAWSFVNLVSRLVVDPERFPDDREVMSAVGMGAVYTRTSQGRRLRADDRTHREAILARYFTPYSSALADLVDDRLEATGRAVILDVHSYPRDAQPYELFADEARPAICLGVDEDHTPPRLVEAATDAFSGLGDIAVNAPFHGTYVPLRHHRQDRRVESLMLELRRDLMPESEAMQLQTVARYVARVVEAASR